MASCRKIYSHINECVGPTVIEFGELWDDKPSIADLMHQKFSVGFLLKDVGHCPNIYDRVDDAIEALRRNLLNQWWEK